MQKLKPPKHLLAAGAALWRDIVSEYGIEDSAGLAILTTAAESLDRMRAAQAAIKKHGETVMDRYGCVKLNPACGLEKDFAQWHGAGAQGAQSRFRTAARSRR